MSFSRGFGGTDGRPAYDDDDDDNDNDDDDDDDDAFNESFEPTLPAGWCMYFDNSEEKYYYYNAITGDSQWDFPLVNDESLATIPVALHPAAIVDTLPISEKYLANVSLSNINNSTLIGNDITTSTKKAINLRINVDNCSMPDYMLANNSSPSSSHTYTPLTSPVHREGASNNNNHSFTSNGNDQYYSDMDDGDNNEICNETEFNTFMSTTINIIKYITPRYLVAPPRIALNEGKAAAAEGGRTQDYLGLARIYKKQRRYSDKHGKCICVLCNKNDAVVVFFPCEHRCVCNTCIEKEQICDERKFLTAHNSSSGYCNCPLCASVIKIMLTGGMETEKYWNWVFEVVPALPAGFMRKWKHTEGVLQKVYIDGDVDYKERFVSRKAVESSEEGGEDGCALC